MTLRGTVVSDGVVVSPETHREAAVLNFYVGVREFVYTFRGKRACPDEVWRSRPRDVDPIFAEAGEMTPWCTPLAVVTRTAPLAVETELGRIFIPPNRAEVGGGRGGGSLASRMARRGTSRAGELHQA